MGKPIIDSAREVARNAEYEDEDNPIFESCSFCNNEVDPSGKNVAIAFDRYMDLVLDGLSWIYSIGSEVGNPPTGGGDGLEWFSTDEIAEEHCWGAVAEGNVDLFRAIEGSLPTDHWTYNNYGWDKAELPFGWKRFNEHAMNPAPVAYNPDSLILSPTRFMATILNYIAFDYESLLKVVKTDTKIWRARTHPDEVPHFAVNGAELGSAPAKYAKANRMSREGESMFYGADELDTALAEIGYSEDQYATAGQFTPTRDLLILDLTLIAYTPSIFSPTERCDFYPIDFLHGFSYDLSKPIGKKPEVGYLPTQLVTKSVRDYQVEKIDGIRFKSSKPGCATNYVLFFQNSDCGDSSNYVLRLDKATVRRGLVLN
ncbi:RES domain-containing protein [Rhodococcus sp. ARC_M6]|uniref:RES domain-containing protein n=1 Tax=Rhodococcus sp. ARC_M6 TaxID=2928852 RepID=UPI001FB2517E|nr:RES domain-containing protein [Rhodococcus sp. ARC_M6]MCJ0907466.1 RES domain-containing protein [Rhodococcus sp. ARC_M6]